MDASNFQRGKLVTKNVVRPAIKVDSSSQVDSLAGDWTSGRLQTRHQVRPAITVDCSTWDYVDHLPTAEDVRRLPRWAKVAFAARCARHVLHIVERHFASALMSSPAQSSSVAETIEYVEGVACSRGYPERDEEFNSEATQPAAERAWAINGLFSLELPNGERPVLPFPVRAALNVAYTAALTAADAIYNCKIAEPNTDDNQHAASAAREAVHATYTLLVDLGMRLSTFQPATALELARTVQIAVVNDFNLLLQLTRFHGWDDESQVARSVFGPLPDVSVLG